MTEQTKPTQANDGSNNPVGFVRLLSSLLGRTKLANMMQFNYGGKRDYYKTFGYPDSVSYDMMLGKYLRQGIAARIVDSPAQALWDNPPTITSNDAEWNRIWNDIVVQNSLWETILRADKLCGLARYSCIFISVSRNRNSNAPRRTSGRDAVNKINFMQVYSQKSAEIDTLETDRSSENFMLPKTYKIYPLQQDYGDAKYVGTPIENSITADAVEMVHLAENTLENQFYGSPRLERVYNDLEDLLKVSGGTAETYWLTGNRGMQLDVDKDMELSPEDAKDLSDEVEEYQNQLRRILRTRGVKVTELGGFTPSPEETFNMIIAEISGATGIPRRLLIGAEAGQLASEQDRANWAERVEARRSEFAEPIVIFPLIQRLTQLGVLPAPENLQVTIEWPDAFKLNPLELAQKSAQHARSATNFANAIKTMTNLKQDIPGTPEQLDAEGNAIPGTGTPEIKGADLDDLITIEEARDMMELTQPKPVFDNVEDTKK